MSKFRNSTDESVYDLSLDGYGEVCGDVQYGSGFHAFVDLDARFAVPYAILTEDTYGFVSVEYFGALSDANLVFAAYVDEDARSEDEDARSEDEDAGSGTTSSICVRQPARNPA